MQSLFSYPPGQPLDFATVEAFCRQAVREGKFIDYKADFPNDLAKVIASFANGDGGLVLIGVVADKKTNAPILPLQGLGLAADLEERVYKVCCSAIYPPIAPLVWVVTFCDAKLTPPDRAILVVRVLTSDLAPHSVDKRKGIYVRTGSVSQPYERATADEILQLSNRRAEASALRTELITQARRRFQFFKQRRFADPDDVRHGLMHCAETQVAICPKYPGRTIATVQQIVEWLRIRPCRKRHIEGADLFPPHGPGQTVQDAALFLKDVDGTLLEVTEVGTRGLISHSFHNTPDECFALHPTQRQLGAPKLFDHNSVGYAVIAVLALSLKFYEHFGLLAPALLKVHITNAKEYTLRQGSSGGGFPCPDEEIRQETELDVAGVPTSYKAIYSEVMTRIENAFGCTVDNETAQNYEKTAERVYEASFYKP